MGICPVRLWRGTGAAETLRIGQAVLVVSMLALAACQGGRARGGRGVSARDTLHQAQILEKANRRPEALDLLRAQTSTPGPPTDGTVQLLREQAAIENDLDLLREADRDYANATVMAQSLKQAPMAAALEVRRARVLVEWDQPDKADELLSQAEAYVRTSGDPYLVPYILHVRGLAREARNQFEEAIAPLRTSLEKFQRDPKQKALAANVMITLAWCYYRLGRQEKALDLYQEAQRIAAPDDQHLALGHLGNIFYDRGDFAKAADYYRQAAAQAKGRNDYYYPKWLDNLAIALIEQGRWAEAEPYSAESLKLERASSPELPPALVTAGRIEAHRGDYQAAEKILRQVAESRQNIAFALDAYSALAELYAQRDKPEEARREFENALALVDETGATLREDENKLSYLASLIDHDKKYVEFLMDCGDAAGAFAVAESSRARLLRERLNLPRATVRSYNMERYKAAAAANGTIFLAYWIGPKSSYLWAISRNKFASYTLPPEAEIESLAAQYEGAIERGGAPRPEELAAGTKLFQLLLPTAALRRGGKYLIVPDGPLYALNFETLPVAGDRPHFWIEDATVAVAPSLDMLLERQAKPTRGRSLLLVGDATEWSAEYPKLAHAGEEMDGIRKLFPERSQKILKGPEATPAAYVSARPGDYSFIHFTAHATANRNSPFDSAIILSRGSAEGGRLSVKEVLSTHVRAELVTISACHSAGARTYWGEGLVGFAWAFLESGAHGVIAGLWDVSDYSSPRLMRNLYAGLARSQVPADALRAAKLELIHNGKYADPYYWGAFQLYEGTL
jgi:CHAT domain-containing protein/Tfp pilus assembly protein PilF